MIKLVLPPTPLASNLTSTLVVQVASKAVDSKLSLERGDRGELYASIDVDVNEFAEILRQVLDELKPVGVSGRLPLVPGRGPGTDGRTISSLLGRQISLRAEKRVEIFEGLANIVKSRGAGVVSELSSLLVDVGRDGVYKLCLGGCDHLVPVVVKSDAFYEIGRFGGASDRRRSGQPKFGRVEYRASTSYTALLYALVLALQSGYESGTNSYMFTSMQLEPGTITSPQAAVASQLYKRLSENIRRVGLQVWSQDYEGLRLAALLWLVAGYHKMLRESLAYGYPENLAFNLTVMSATGNRFYTLWSTSISFAETDASLRALETLAEELEADVYKVANYAAILIASTLKLCSEQTGGSVNDLWQGVKMLAYALLTGSKHMIFDTLYRLLRLLDDPHTGLQSSLTNAVLSTANTIGVRIDDVLPEGGEEKDRGRAVWRALKKLVESLIM